MFVRRQINNSDEQENIFWITMTDLLLGLAIIFIVLFVLAMTGFSQLKLQLQAVKSDVAKELDKHFKINDIDAQVDLTSGMVKISDLNLFELGSYELSENGKNYLDKFIPIYLDLIFANSKIEDKIVNIVIQGHTDSHSFAGNYSKEQQFVKNLELSTQRANAVAKYIFSTNFNRKYSNKLRKLLIVEGKSNTEPIIINGKEDFDKSRRVELEFIVKESTLENFMGINR